MDKETRAFFAGIVIGIVIVLLLHVAVISPLWKKEAIDHKCAAYSSTTGEWHWLNKEVSDEKRLQRDNE